MVSIAAHVPPPEPIRHVQVKGGHGGLWVPACVYVGSDVDVRFRYAGHHLIGTTRSRERMDELQELMHEAHQLDITDAEADIPFLEHLDGVLISEAPTLDHSNPVNALLPSAEDQLQTID